jgi:hypothetical protein
MRGRSTTLMLCSALHVISQRAAHRVQLEIELAFFRRPHRRGFPLLLIVEPHEDLRLLGPEAIDSRTNGDIAVASDRRVAGQNGNALDGDGLTRQLGTQQQVTTAEAPVRRPHAQQQRECEQGDTGNGSCTQQATPGYEGGRRSLFGDAGGIGSEQLDQR